MLPDFSRRAAMDELMDAPDCDETRLLRTVRQFASINRQVARYRTILKRWVLDDMQDDPAREYHLVDMGAGGCDIDVWLLQAARRRGLKLRITACDMDARTITYARSVYGQTPGLSIRKTDLLVDAFDEPVDYVFANHFLHHLTGEEILRLLRLWQPRVRRRMVFSDLLRSPVSYMGFSALSLFYRDSFARTDGLISIRKGFLPRELAAMADAATGGGFSVHRLLPGRLVLCIGANSAGAS
ncbi:MAG: methyltransferase domain-containing protein [Kiritimatiellales bacterium]|nr:methyltransferase domain-containing protein [Kiritimatiellales bacterium]